VIFDALIDEYPDRLGYYRLRGFVAALLGDTAVALDDLRKFEQMEQRDRSFSVASAYNRLVILGALGEDERVAEMLADAHNWWDFTAWDPSHFEFDPIRDHPAFQELVRPKG
jgi:hypothetical protein